MKSNQKVIVEIAFGPQVEVDWTQNMNAQQALERAWEKVHDTEIFTYGLQYYGADLGYMVFMINETYDSFLFKAQPFFYWHFYVDNVPMKKGIDGATLQPGNRVLFSYERYVPEKHAGTLMEQKFKFQQRQLK